MKDTMTYKGYLGFAHYSAEDDVFHGKLDGIRDLVTFEASDVSQLEASFHEAVEDYLEIDQERREARRRPGTP